MSDILAEPLVSGDDHRAVRPRGLVPSERQRAAGAGVPPVEVAAPAAAPTGRRTVRARARQIRADLDPRDLMGPGRTLPLAVLGLSSLFSGWDDAAFNLLLPEIQRDLKLELGFVIALGTLVKLVRNLIAPALGYVADRVRRTRMLAIGQVIANGASMLTGLAGGVTSVAGARGLGGVGESLTGPSMFPLLTDWFSVRQRARVISLIGMAGAVGALVGPVVAGQLGDRIGWRSVMLLLGGLATVFSLPFFLLKDPVRGVMDRREMGADEEAAGIEQKPVSWAEGWRATRSILTLRRLWYATPFMTAGGSLATGLMALYFAHEFGVDSAARGWIVAANIVLVTVSLPLIGGLIDRLIPTRPTRVFALLAGVLLFNAGALVLLATTTSLPLSIAVYVPLMIASAMMFPAQLALSSLVIPARLRAFGISTTAPWQVVGYLMIIVLTFYLGNDIRRAMLILVPVFIVGAALMAYAGTGVKPDLRAALAASMADEEARRARARGGNRMLILRDVAVAYEGTQAVFGVDLDVEEGDMIALLGTNGAGKSSVLRAIAGIQEASGGAIFLDGEDITHRPTHEIARLGVVFMPGGQAIFPNLTVEENLAAAAWSSTRGATIEDALAVFPELRARLGEAAGNLSGGEQQMVALGQVLLMSPRLLMIDELSLGLAPAVVERLLDVVRQINADGTTVLLVEQSLNVAVTLAERALFMERGEIRFDGSTAELLGRHDLVRSVFLTGGGGGGHLAMGGGLARPTREYADTDVLRVEGIHLAYGGRQVLRGIDLEVRSGEVVGLVGPNGAGKTSLFDVITGHTPVDAGTVRISGADVTLLAPDARARLGLARSFQSARLWPSMTVRENIAVALELQLGMRSAVAAAMWLPGMRRSERRAARRVEHLIELFELGRHADKFVRELSTGTRRMLDMACVMAAQPAVLLLDEPSAGVAQAEVELFAPLVRRLAKETGCGIVVIEHDMPLLAALSDRAVALVLGAIAAAGTVEEVLADPLVVEGYLGTDQATINRSGRRFAPTDNPITARGDDE